MNQGELARREPEGTLMSDQMPPPPTPGYEGWADRVIEARPSTLRPRRPGIVTAAAVLLLVAGGLAVVASLLILSAGDRTAVQGIGADAVHTVGLVALVIGSVEVLAGVLVLRLIPAGRVLGLIFAGLGLLGALRSLGTPQGIITLAVDGFVVYALATTGDAFRRATRG
jgi:hypothetical protein